MIREESKQHTCISEGIVGENVLWNKCANAFLENTWDGTRINVRSSHKVGRISSLCQCPLIINTFWLRMHPGGRGTVLLQRRCDTTKLGHQLLKIRGALGGRERRFQQEINDYLYIFRVVIWPQDVAKVPFMTIWAWKISAQYFTATVNISN